MIDENEFTWEDKVYTAQKIVGDDDYCDMCKLRDIEDACDKALCLSTQRKDNSNVIFVEKEEAQLNNVANNTEGKKDEFKLPDNMKIWCDGKRYGAKVQERLFELGYKWSSMGNTVWHPNGDDGYAIYVDEEQLMSWGDRCDYEMEDDYPKYHFIETTGEIISVDKETQEDKSATKDTTNNNKPESLDSLFKQIVLLQKENDSLVEQKEQLVNNISANTQAINILKDKMQQYLNQIGNVFVGNDKVDVVEEGKILDITDWQDLKVGDVVEITSVHKGTLSNGYEKFIGAVATVLSVDDPKYQNLEVLAINTRLWIDGFKFVSRPNK